MTFPEPNVGKALAMEMGREWARLDCVDHLIGAMDWLRKGGSLTAVADRLRSIAVVLEEGDALPLGYMSYQLDRQVGDLQAIVDRRTRSAA